MGEAVAAVDDFATNVRFDSLLHLGHLYVMLWRVRTFPDFVEP